MRLLIDLSDVLLVAGLASVWLALSMISFVAMIKAFRWLKFVWRDEGHLGSARDARAGSTGFYGPQDRPAPGCVCAVSAHSGQKQLEKNPEEGAN